MSRILPILCASMVAALLLARVPAEAQDDNATRDMITTATQGAIDQGLAFLARTQNADGSFGVSQIHQGNVAFTGLAGLALMAGGHQPGRGKYGANVRRAVENVLENEDPKIKGFFHRSRQGGGHTGPMYQHGFATLFLAEAHGMVSQPELRDRLRAALGRSVELIIKSQNRLGGWRYQPGDGDHDISATICQIMALRAARNAGFSVPKEVADKCVSYVKSCQDKVGGGFRYRPEGGPTGFAKTSAGLVALYSSGIYEGEEVDKALGYLMRSKPGGNAGGGGFFGNIENQAYYHYGHYYAAQATWIAGGKYWREWYPAIRDELLASRRPDGSWANGMCPHYCTAMSLIILQIPNRYLPILQR